MIEIHPTFQPLARHTSIHTTFQYHNLSYSGTLRSGKSVKISSSILFAILIFFSYIYYVHSLTHGAEPFVRSCQLCSYSRTQHFMKPEGSLQEPSTGPILRQINPIHPIPSCLSKINFNIIHSLTSRFS
jgi:hypothetical protein